MAASLKYISEDVHSNICDTFGTKCFMMSILTIIFVGNKVNKNLGDVSLIYKTG